MKYFVLENYVTGNKEKSRLCMKNLLQNLPRAIGLLEDYIKYFKIRILQEYNKISQIKSTNITYI